MSDNTIIKTTRIVYPQIYAYVLPKYEPNEGWVKIGYTELQSVDARIRQQTHTAGIVYSKLWSEPAKFCDSDDWFFDKQLHAYLRKFKGVEQRPNTEWFYYNGTPGQSHVDFDEFRHKQINQVGKKLEYQLRDEQEFAVKMTLDYAVTHQGGEFLWNAKPRFGKTLTTYDFARRINAQRVLIVTNRPAIANSWFDDFKAFIAWQTNYRFVSTTDSLKERPVLTRDQFLKIPSTSDGKYPGCIAFISLQDLKGSISFGGTFDKLKWVKDLKWDLLVIDEAHEGVDTFKTDVAFTNITRDFTLHLSGTPFKAVASGRFSEDQIFTWTYADEQEAKSLWPADSEENNPYEGLPRLNLFSYQMSQMTTDEVNKGAEIDGKDIDFTFDLNEFFATGDNGKFIHETEVKKWLDTLTRNDKYPFSTPELRAELKHTFWLLNRVASAKALEKLLRGNPVFENYEIVLAAGDGRSEDDQIIDQNSLDRVREAIGNHNRTITLSVGQLTTGVTVPEWTAVLMLSNIKSPSLYMQAAFRAQNQWDFDIDGEKQRKQNAYVFDFAPERTLIIYDEFANNLNSNTVCGGGTTDDREVNIRKLLNFFPVIAEDSDGKMVELDVRQILTIPKTIKAQEVVKRGFMSNFLFQNISGIFTSTEAREILEQLNPVDLGKVNPRKLEEPIDTKGVQLDADGNAAVDHSIVIAETNARFGEKVYADVVEKVENALTDSPSNLTNAVASAFTQNVLDTIKQLAKENKVTMAQAELVVNQNANVIAREVEIVKRKADIRQSEAKVEYERQIASAYDDLQASAEAKARYEAAKQEITKTLKQDIACKVEEKTKELTQKSTEEILKKAEEKNKTTVEDDIRARLRGFARTIPSFLMAYGEPSTALSNFDKTIKDSVFKEVTGISLDQFRALRDTYNFFDSVVFDESVQEFLRKKEKLANYFDDSKTEDIFDYIPPQKTNQIFTPKWVVKLMVDSLEEENPDLFTNKDKTFVDLYVKSGLYLTEIVKRLFIGLEDIIPDKDKRLKHILEHQVYGFAPSEIIYNIAKNFVFGSFAEISDAHLQDFDLTETAKNGGSLDMKFDVVVGNPPYQKPGEARDEPIYHYFYDLAAQTSLKYCLISPARFLFNAGQTPKSWNEKMLSDEHLKVEYFEQNSVNVFPSTAIIGGISIIYRDEEKIYGGIGIFTRFDELNSIISKTSIEGDDNFAFLVQPQGIYRFTEQFFVDFPQAEEMQGKGTKNKIVSKAFSQMDFAFHGKKTNTDEVRILGLVGAKRVFRWIRKEYLQENTSLSKYKVFISESNGASGTLGENAARLISTPLLGLPFTAHTDTFLSIGAFNTEAEAIAVLKYIKTKFVRVLLGVHKVTQHNSRSTWTKVPLQNFTQQSDIDWTESIPEIDRQLYAKYSLDEKEIAFIEEKVKPME
jgi:superfamily II DNA or RNA helicase